VEQQLALVFFFIGQLLQAVNAKVTTMTVERMAASFMDVMVSERS
jgi:hypothetical protein